jgi:Fic family protein
MPRISGRYERSTTSGKEVNAFVPFALPPREPDLVPDTKLLQAAEEALRHLEVAVDMVSSMDWFLYGFVRKEAVLSSQIEGVEATLTDLMTVESQPPTSVDADVQDVCNYLAALEFARNQLADPKGLPLSMRLLNETHAILMSGVRGADKAPGEPRRSQNWIGGTRPGNAKFVPPPPHLLPEVLTDLEKYMHAEKQELSALVQVGLVHAQFETIHPYLDGNGRLGRLLITLLFEHWKLLSKPMLYLSLFFKRHRDDYYQRLTAVRSNGDWEGWMSFFLEGVAAMALESVQTAKKLFRLVSQDRERVVSGDGVSISSVRLFEQLPRRPILTAAGAETLLSTTRPTATKAISTLVDLGVLKEVSGKQRDRSFVYVTYLDVLASEVAP